MTEEQVLINHIQEYLDSGMWQHEACYLNRSDLKVIINALEQESVLDKIRAEIVQIPTISFNANDIYKADVLQIIDKYRKERMNDNS